MSQTAAQTQTRRPAPDTTRRSLRGVVAAGSTLGAIAGPAYSTLRLGRTVFEGDKVIITVDDDVDAQGLAAALGLGPEPISHHAQSHDWTGTAGGLDVTVRGSGYLPVQVPDRLVGDALRDPNAPSDGRLILNAIPSQHWDDAKLDALTDTDRGSIPVHVLLEVAAIAVAVALSFALPIGTAAALMGAVFALTVLGAYAVVRIQDVGRRRAHLAARRTLASDIYDAVHAARRTVRAVRAWARHRLATPEAAYDAQVESLTDARVLTLSAGEIR